MINTKFIEVSVSQTLSSLVTIEVPVNFDIKNEKTLKKIIKEQIRFPSDIIDEYSKNVWIVDDYSIIVED